MVYRNECVSHKIVAGLKGNHIYHWHGTETSLHSGFYTTLQWRHNEGDGASNHQCFHCLLKCLFRHRSKEKPKLCGTALCGGIHRWPVNSPHKGPVTRKRFPFDDVIMNCTLWTRLMLISDCYWLIQVSSPSMVALLKSVIPFLNPINITVRVFIWNIWSWEFCHSCFYFTMFAFHYVEVQALVR